MFVHSNLCDVTLIHVSSPYFNIVLGAASLSPCLRFWGWAPMLIKKEIRMNYEIRLSLTSYEPANILPLTFVRILSLVFNASWLFWIKIDLLFLILWKFKRLIASDNLSGKITLGYLTKPRASDGLWWSLQLWDNIEKKMISGNKLSRLKFRSAVLHLSQDAVFKRRMSTI